MTRKVKYALTISLTLLLLGRWARAADGVGVTATPTASLAMDFGSLPPTTLQHYKTKWSGPSLLLYDSGAGAPVLYAFDRSGRLAVNAVIQLEGANQVTLTDFASTDDGSTIWASGFSSSPSGQLSNFIAAISDGGAEIKICRTYPYEPLRIAVAPDGSVWTVGFEAPIPNSEGKRAPIDRSLNVLRHFDASGKFLSSAVPLSTVRDFTATENGRLAVSADRVAWYAPDNSPNPTFEHYFEYFPATHSLKSYPAVPGEARRTLVITLVLTPSNEVYAYADESLSGGRGNKASVFRLDRTSEQWVPIALPGEQFADLQGNDGESLVFNGPPDKSRIRLVNVH